MESRTLRYRTNVPFCNACSEERDSHCKVILILKLAYRTNFSLVGSYFSLEIFLQDHRKIVNIQTSHEKCNDRYTANKSNVLSRKVERQIPINVFSASLFYDGVQHGKCRNYSNLSDRIVRFFYSYTRFFPSLAEIKS